MFPIALTTAVQIASGILSVWQQVQEGPLTESEGTAMVNNMLMVLHNAIAEWKAAEAGLATAAAEAGKSVATSGPSA